MALAGKYGKICISTGKQIASTKSWSLELSLDTLETTALGDEWKKYIAGLKEWNASCEGDYAINSDATGQKALQDAYLSGTEVTIELYVDSSNYYTGKAYISSLSIEDPVDDVVSFSCEFTGNGTLEFQAGTSGPGGSND